MARKHLGWYTKGLPGSAEFRNRVNFIDDAAEVVACARRVSTHRSAASRAGGMSDARELPDWQRPDAQRQLASLPLAVLLLAPDLTIAAANPAAEQFFGQSAAPPGRPPC